MIERAKALFGGGIVRSTGLFIGVILASAAAAFGAQERPTREELVASLLSRDEAAQQKAYEEMRSRPDCVTDLIGIVEDSKLRPPRNRDLQGTNKRAVVFAAWALGDLRSKRAIGPLADMLSWFAFPNHDVDSTDYVGDFDAAHPAVKALQRIGRPAAEELLRRVADGRIESSTEMFLILDVAVKGLGMAEGRALVKDFLDREDDACRGQRLMNAVFIRYFDLKQPDKASEAQHGTDAKTGQSRLHIILGFVCAAAAGAVGMWLLLRRRAG
jgi:hypothetical protein